MQLGPSLYQSSLSPGQAAGEQLYRVEPVHSFVITMVGVKVRCVMWPKFAIHADDDAVEATEFRHNYTGRSLRMALRSASPAIGNYLVIPYAVP